MTDMKYDEKFKEMQKYLPFLQKVIDKLKMSSDQREDNPRKAQLQKMEMLYNLLTDKGKKLKMETLLKCEGVLIKLYTKMEKSESETSTTNKYVPDKVPNENVAIVDITGPASPPPQQVEEELQPVEIPTERQCSPLIIYERRKCDRSERNHRRENREHDKQRYHKHPAEQHYQDDRRHHGISTERSYSHEHGMRDRLRENKSVGSDRLDWTNRSTDTSLPWSRNSPSSSVSASRTMHQRENHAESYIDAQTHQNPFRKPHHKNDGQHVHRDELYSPEESWNEIANNDSRSARNISVADLVGNSSPQREIDQVIFDKVLGFRKQHNVRETRKESGVFDRLGDKVGDHKEKGFENFKIKVANDRIGVKNKVSPNKTQAPISIPVKVPSIPEVLQSPPLTASDISNLLNESMDMNSNRTPSILEIGTRRPPKAATPINIANASVSDLDMVRKKLAIVSRASPQFLESPASPVATTSSPSINFPSPNQNQSERIALKYHPHPRAQRAAAKTVPYTDDKYSSVAPLPTNVNVLPSINLSDPRLKKIAAKSEVPAKTPLLPTPSAHTTIPALVPPNFHFPTCSKQSPIYHNNTRLNPSTSLPTERSCSRQDPRLRHFNAPVRKCFSNNARSGTPVPTKPAYRTSPPRMSGSVGSQLSTVCGKKDESCEENWDSDPETSQTPVMSHNKSNEQGKPTKQTNVDSSSEENWDSEPESTTVKSAPQATSTAKSLLTQNIPKTVPTLGAKMPSQTYSPGENWDHEIDKNVPIPVMDTGNQIVPEAELSFTALKNTSLDNNSTFRYKAPPVNKHSAPKQSNTATNRFSALLNDKSERIKYFESKKQKLAEPRTYGEFKQAKARAAAEKEAKKNATDDAVKKAIETDDVSVEKSTAASVTNGSPLQVPTKLAPESTLDKLYRSSNFKDTTFPKTNTNFKIPKKQTVAKEVDEKAEPKEQTVTKKCENKLEGSKAMQTEKLAKTIVRDQERETVLKPEDTTFIGDDGSNEKKKLKHKETTREQVEKPETRAKTTISVKGKQAINKNNTALKSEDAMLTGAAEKNEDINLKKKEATLEQAEKPDLTTKAPVTVKVKQTITKSSTVQKKEDTSCEEPATDAVEKKAQTTAKDAKDTADDLIEISSDEEIKSNEQVPVKQVVKEDLPTPTSTKYEQEFPSFKPQRILKRRCTMIAFGSTPEVDKEKLNASNSLLYEDIRERAVLKKHTMEELMKQAAARKTKNLSDMFQKTDDNCTVSTQNIISGKRRTRTTVNFNEVETTRAIYGHNSAKKVKGTPNTNATNQTSAVTKACHAEKTEEEQATEEVVKDQDKLKDNNQSCAVSSTTSQGDVNTDETVRQKRTKRRQSVEDAADAEPSSSGKLLSCTPTPPDEDNGRRDLLEGFVQDILKPNADTTYIFNLLSQILSKEKLQLVKTIIESAAKENSIKLNDSAERDSSNHEEMLVTEASADATGELEEERKIELGTQKGNTPRREKKFKKRNELDRLNDDIRDMFISHGVLTATGRRMCTLVAAAAKEKGAVSPENAKKKDDLKLAYKAEPPKVTPEEQETTMKPITQRMRKSKVVLSPINFKQFRRSTRAKASLNKQSKKEDSEMTNATAAATAMDTPPRSNMPVLKPNTPIKLSKELLEDVTATESAKLCKKRKLEVKLIKLKPGPKSRKLTRAVNPIKVEEIAESEDEQEDVASTKTEHALVDTLKNNNPNWHHQSKYIKFCIVCNVPVSYTGMHYKKEHSENYISRLAPSILQQFKEGKLSKPVYCIMLKGSKACYYRCPFCLVFNCTPLIGWLGHFSSHTSEYNFECSSCHRSGNKMIEIYKHVQKCEKGSTMIRNNIFSGSRQRNLDAHVCHLCNFMQLKRENLERHYIQQHGCDKDKVNLLGYSIQLINFDDVEMVVDRSRAVELEKIALATCKREPVILYDDDDEDKDELTEPENSEVAVAEKDERKEESNECDMEVKMPVSDAKLSELADAPDDDNDVGTSDLEACQNDLLQLAALAEAEENNIAAKAAAGADTCSTASNVFMPTREINDSPIFDSFAHSFLQTEHAETQSALDSGSKRGVLNNGGLVTSIAERLSQRFRGLKVPQGRSLLIPRRSSLTTATDTIPTIEAKQKSTLTTVESVEISDVSIDQTAAVDASSSFASSGNNSLVIVEDNNDTQTAELEAADNCDGASNIAEDDDEWEDIEVVESAPSTCSSIVSAASTVSKEGKTKARTVFPKFNRFFATKTAKKLKKHSGVSCGEVEKKQTEESEKFSSCDLTEEESRSTPCFAADSEMHSFQPIISTLDDLLPDSPCNDPIDLVPELAPLEPLQDLNDISSILDSNFGALDTHSMLQGMDLETANSVCINTDNHQTSIQEALDFVTEQQQYDALNMAATEENLSFLQASILRIQNVGYSVVSEQANGLKFYCLSEQCTFLYSSEAIGLENHYLSEHPELKWNGYCDICKVNVLMTDVADDASEKHAISLEIKHMLEQHAVPACSINTDYGKTVDAEDKPRLKIRRLTGDCLSTTPTRNTPTMELRSDGSAVLNEHTNLSDLLNAKPRPPTKPMTPMYPIAHDTIITISEPLYKSLGSDFTITSVSSGGPLPSELEVGSKATPNSSTSNCPLQISNVMSLNDAAADATSSGTDGDSDPVTVTSDASKAVPKPIQKSSTSNCPIQISNVMSLSDAATDATSSDATSGDQATVTSEASTAVPLLKITSVCSLRGKRGTSAAATGTLWAKHIENERVELTKSAAESLEVSRILANARKSVANDSPEPVVVAETLPVAQATAGDFLITQTVSAHHAAEGTQVGFNISIATHPSTSSSSASNSSNASPAQQPSANVEKAVPQIRARPHFICKGTGCKYQTRVAVAMSDHLRFHECRSFSAQRDYLRCSVCDYFADDIDDYFKHAELEHGMDKPMHIADSVTASTTITSSTTESEASSTSILTKTIRNILSGALDATSASRSDKPQTSAAPPATKPYRQQLEETIKDIVRPTGVDVSKLYRCVFDNCESPLTESTFQKHLVFHLSALRLSLSSNYNYKCPHCTATYQRPASIKVHIKSHGRHHYFCYICSETALNSDQMLKHFTERHWRSLNVHTATLHTCSTYGAGVDADEVYYVANGLPISELEVQQFGEKLIADWQCKKAALRTHFKPSEVHLLPIKPIFQREVSCAECLYKTKVRTNMLRHLLAHKCTVGPQVVGNVDPVNPVPCLNTKERHFDKMTNLASSSLVPNSGSVANKVAFKPNYAYMAEAQRYKCGFPGCKYLAATDDTFRTHLRVWHNSNTSYNCPFCWEEICKRNISVERILQHLRYHSQVLYQCEECDYLHYMRNVVDRHIQEKHNTARVNLVKHERTVNGALEGTVTSYSITGKKYKGPAEFPDLPGAMDTATISAKSKQSHKWVCDLCGHTTNTQPQIAAHCFSQHHLKQQYQCVHCSFSAAQLTHIMAHIDEKHAGKTRETRYIYHRLSNEPDNTVDTTPLWQRDDPKRVRHIRGILMEDEEESEQYRKRLCLDDNDSDDDDDGNEDNEAGASAKEDSSELTEDAREHRTSAKVATVGNSTGASTSAAAAQGTHLYFGLYEFGCYHCDYKHHNLRHLKEQHWKAEHASHSHPFFFRLLNYLKCPECKTFCGNYNKFQLHLQLKHGTRAFAALDANSQSKMLVCGYCGLYTAQSANLYRHHRRAGHKPQDLKRLTPDHMQQILKQGSCNNYVLCTQCNKLYASRADIRAHVVLRHSDDAGYSFQELNNALAYRCAICAYTSTDEMATLRHMIEHYGQFKRCCYCHESQSNFTEYMQHLYAEHRQNIEYFNQVYTLEKIRSYLQQIFVIFPNGLNINKLNLRNTKYGRENYILQLYEEICKTAREPPIPRLSIARLVARKSIEARQCDGSSPILGEERPVMSTSTAAAMQLAGDNFTKPQTSKRISKRRSTVALGSDERQCSEFAIANSCRQLSGAINKKRKLVGNLPAVPQPSFSTVVLPPPATPHPVGVASTAMLKPYSFYGRTPEPIDWSVAYTKVAIGGVDTPLKLDKFKLLFNIDAYVPLHKLHETDIEAAETNSTATYEQYSHVKKACPASQKHKYTSSMKA